MRDGSTERHEDVIADLKRALALKDEALRLKGEALDEAIATARELIAIIKSFAKERP
jgi:hypothetical protein